jgi:hypothetical protein
MPYNDTGWATRSYETLLIIRTRYQADRFHEASKENEPRGIDPGFFEISFTSLDV